MSCAPTGGGETTGGFNGASTTRSGRPAVTATVSRCKGLIVVSSGAVAGWSQASLMAARREPLYPDKVEDRE